MDHSSSSATLERDQNERPPAPAVSDRPPQTPPEDLFAQFQRRFNDLRDSGTDYLYATLDAWRVGMKTVVLRLVVALAAAFAAAITLTTGIILLLLGIARTISWLFSAPEWVGTLSVGVLIVGTALIGGLIFLKSHKRLSLEQAKERYAARRARKAPRTESSAGRARQNGS